MQHEPDGIDAHSLIVRATNRHAAMKAG